MEAYNCSTQEEEIRREQEMRTIVKKKKICSVKIKHSGKTFVIDKRVKNQTFGYFREFIEVHQKSIQ